MQREEKIARQAIAFTLEEFNRKFHLYDSNEEISLHTDALVQGYLMARFLNRPKESDSSKALGLAIIFCLLLNFVLLLVIIF